MMPTSLVAVAAVGKLEFA